MDHLPPPPPTDPIDPLATNGPNKDERTWAMLAHLSIIIASFVGLIFLGPLLVWIVKKDESAFVDMHGKEALNFSLSWTLWIVLSLFFACITFGLGLILTSLIGLVVLVLSIIAGVAANDGKDYKYPMTIRFIK